MPLLAETGAITPGANAYADVPTVDSYHADRGNTAWADATEAQKTAAILAATAYLDGKYRARWKGARVSPVVQPLEWPRLGIELDWGPWTFNRGVESKYSYYPANVIPPEVVAATCELALRALSGPLAADIAPRDRVRRKKIDVLDTEYATTDFTTTYQVVDQLVSRFLKSGCEAVRG